MILLLASPASAQTTSWQPSTGSWFQIDNWNNGLPTSSSNASIINNGTAQIGTGASAEVFDIIIGSTSGTGTLHVTNGSLTVANFADVGTGVGASGSLVIDGGNMMVSELIRIGDADGAGSMTMTSGTFSAFNVNFGHSGLNTSGEGSMSGGTWTSSQLWVGYASGGEFELSGGNMFTSILGIGHTPTYDDKGTLTISGGRLEATLMVVGRAGGGSGLLNLTAGQLVTGTTTISESGVLGNEIGSGSGDVTVSGGTWENTGTLNASINSLRISGGLVKAANFQGGFELSGSGVLEVGGFSSTGFTGDGGTLRVTQNAPQFAGFGSVIQLNTGGLKFDTNGYNIGIQATFVGTGPFTKLGAGTLTMLQSVPDGIISVEQGTLVTGLSVTSTGFNVAAGATLDISSGFAVLPDGKYLRGGGTVVGEVRIEGELAPGTGIATLTFADDLTLDLSAETLIELSSGSLFDRIQIDGEFAYGGTLRIQFLGGYMPALGDDFDLFGFTTYEGASAFDSIVFDTPGYTGIVDPATGTLSIIAIPEPQSIVLCLMAAFAWGVGLRRR